MFEYTITKRSVPDGGIYLSQLQEVNISVVGYFVKSDAIVLSSSQEIYSGGLSLLDAVIPAQVSAQKNIEIIIENAIQFGHKLVVKFAAENVLLGITQAGKTKEVRESTATIVSALQTGSLYDAIDECRNVPAEDKDTTFVTDARLLGFVNEIEAYLGATLSTTL